MNILPASDWKSAAATFRDADKNFHLFFILAADHSGETHFKGASLPPYSHYDIPGVQVPLSGIIDELLADPLLVQVPAAHSKYVIEVQLPFLYSLKGQPQKNDFAIIPMIPGQMDDTDITRLAGPPDSIVPLWHP